MRIILASASPRRKELLTQIGFSFDVMVSNVEERTAALDPEKIVEELSERKAKAVLEGILPEGEAVLVIGADTVVAVGKRILGKPKNPEEAADMLSELSDRTHEVYTGVSLLYRDEDGREKHSSFHEMTKVTFFPMSQAEIDEYISTGDGADKAGAYGIQGFCARYIKGICGDYNNVVGLPVGRLYQEVREMTKV